MGELAVWWGPFHVTTLLFGIILGCAVAVCFFIASTGAGDSRPSRHRRGARRQVTASGATPHIPNLPPPSPVLPPAAGGDGPGLLGLLLGFLALNAVGRGIARAVRNGAVVDAEHPGRRTAAASPSPSAAPTVAIARSRGNEEHPARTGQDEHLTSLGPGLDQYGEVIDARAQARR